MLVDGIMVVIKFIMVVFGVEIEFFDFDWLFDVEIMVWFCSVLLVYGVLVF